MVPSVSVVGLSGSGKTTLIEKLIKELTGRGYRVGTVKHDAHGFEIDHEGKDSWRHKKAGAECVVLASAEKLAVIKDVHAGWPVERLISTYLDDVDIAVIEGFKGSKLPKIEVVRKMVSESPVCGEDKTLLAVAGDFEVDCKKPVFDINDSRGMADLIENEIITGFKRQSVTLIVDGRPVSLKPFIDNLIREGVLGMIKSLKGCGEPGSVELRIGKR